MTVCIAAVCPSVHSIVLVFDTQLSYGTWTSSQGADKFGQLAPKWFVMFAGEADRFLPLLNDAKRLLGGARSRDQVQAACRQAVGDALKARIPYDMLPPGMTYEQFMKYGRLWMGEKFSNGIHEKIADPDYGLGIDLLVAGYDDDGPSIFEVTQRGAISVPHVDFHAIGTGWQMAYAVLNPEYMFTWDKDLATIIYKVCSAKFASESASGVGPETTLIVLSEDGTMRFMVGVEVDRIRALWKRKGRPPVPRGVGPIVTDCLLTPEEKLTTRRN